jgi:hypothetical protein
MRGLQAMMMLLAMSGCAQAESVAMPQLHAAASQPSPATVPGPVNQELARLRAAFAEEVPKAITLEPDRLKELIAHGRAMLADNAVLLDRPQLIVVVDRNPAAQEAALLLAQHGDGPWELVGATKVSTGQRGRFDYYITPTGIFRHTDTILGYRAEGTYNENGIRGLGAKGMRVWDFGWQNAMKGWRSDGERGDIRLLMHATDPVALEPRLGRPASQGCVRVPAAMNVFLDRHGVLDSDYERAAQTDQRYARLLRQDRTPTSLAGNMMVVVDSNEPL